MWIAIAALNMALAVMAGAFGAHALKASLTASQLDLWHTATQYWFVHAIGLAIVGLWIEIDTLRLAVDSVSPSSSLLNAGSALALQLGIILFCGSLIALALGSPKWIGAITPIGGLAFILGWVLLAISIFKSLA